MSELDSTQPIQKKSSTARTLRIILLVVFGIAAILVAYLTFVAVRDFVSSWQITDLPGVALVEATTGASDSPEVVTRPDVPLQDFGGPTPPAWDGARRVNILVMGLDYRDWSAGEGPPRTDTMILLTLDPVNHTAGMLSIPRDLWVSIPGYNYARINTAYMLGEANKEPGGGPALAMKTVEELLGVPIDYYAQIDFEAFIRFIDEIGGVKINVAEKIKVDPITPGKKNNTVTLKPGLQTLTGELALAYARARKTQGGDFDRAQRTQQVIMGIRNQVLREDMVPVLVSKAGILYNQLASGIHTNLTLDQALRLGWLAVQIPDGQIKQGIIGPPDQVSFAKSPDGEQDVLKPITEKIRQLRDDIFSTGVVSPAANNMALLDLIKAEGARVRILNGTTTAGVASETAEYLKSQGLNVVEAGNAQAAPATTEITFFTGKPYTIKYLVDLMKISPFRIFYVADPASPVDIEINLGPDWVQNNPMQ
jgi:LCP family protein required for cell wall assembly